MCKTFDKFLTLVVIVMINGLVACSSPESNKSTDNQEATVDPTFWLEPGNETMIGVGQMITVYAASKISTDNEFPIYVNPTEITWTNSNPTAVSLTADGVAIGLTEGTTTLKASYEGQVSQLIIQVSGQMISRNIAVPGQTGRKYSIYIPNLSGDDSLRPAFLSLHGGGGSAMQNAASSQINKLAQEQKFFVAHLEGTGVIQTFNGGACCGSAQTNNVNDVVYAKAVINDIVANYKINSAKIFSTGFSNGSIMSHRLACAISDQLAGIAAVGGGASQFDFNLNQYYTCNPTRPIPILHIHSKNDRNYPIEGGFGEGISSTNYYPVASGINDWIVRNNLVNIASIEQVSATTKCYHYTQAANTLLPSAPVTYCVDDPVDIYDPITEVVFGGGHAWPGGVRGPGNNSDVPNKNFSANTYIYKFLNP